MPLYLAGLSTCIYLFGPRPNASPMFAKYLYDVSGSDGEDDTSTDVLMVQR